MGEPQVGKKCVKTNFQSFCCCCRTDLQYFYGNAFLDIDECSEGVDDCDSDADCINSNGGYTCVCRDTYSGNGTFCSRKTICFSRIICFVTSFELHRPFLILNFLSFYSQF